MKNLQNKQTSSPTEPTLFEKSRENFHLYREVAEKNPPLCAIHMLVILRQGTKYQDSELQEIIDTFECNPRAQQIMTVLYEQLQPAQDETDTQGPWEKLRKLGYAVGHAFGLIEASTAANAVQKELSKELTSGLLPEDITRTGSLIYTYYAIHKAQLVLLNTSNEPNDIESIRRALSFMGMGLYARQQFIPDNQLWEIIYAAKKTKED